MRKDRSQANVTRVYTNKGGSKTRKEDSLEKRLKEAKKQAVYER
jgi:hypothetical protein